MSATSSFGTTAIHTGVDRVPANDAVNGRRRRASASGRGTCRGRTSRALPAIVIPPGSVGVTRARSVEISPYRAAAARSASRESDVGPRTTCVLAVGGRDVRGGPPRADAEGVVGHGTVGAGSVAEVPVDGRASAHVAVNETASGAGPRVCEAENEQSAACAGAADASAASATRATRRIETKSSRRS